MESNQREWVMRPIETLLEIGDAGTRRVSLVGEWPEQTAFSGSAWREAEHRLLLVDGDRIVVTLANGTAVYRVVAREEHMDRVLAVREA